MTRNIDNLGRIVLPVEIRRQLRMFNGTSCNIRVDGSNVILSRCNSGMKAVNGVNLVGIEWKGICPYCSSELMERFNKTCCGNCGNSIVWEKEK